MTLEQRLRRRRAATIAGYARIQNADPDELDAMRRRGGEARAAQTRGDSLWGKYLAERKRLRRFGATTTEDLAARVAALEKLLITDAKTPA